MAYLSLYKFFHGSVWYSYVELGSSDTGPITRNFSRFLNQLDLIVKRQGSEFHARFDFWVRAQARGGGR